MLSLRPSTAPIWGPCPGSIRLAKYCAPDERSDTEHAREGRAVHELGASMIRDGRRAIPGWVIPETSTEGVIYTPEMIRHARYYADTVLRMARDWPKLQIETTVAIDRIAGADHMYGTPDVWALDPDRPHVHIWDYKNGFARVKAEGNLQGVCYAAGVLDTLYVTKMVDEREAMVFFHIIQPRNYEEKHSVWMVSAAELRNYANRLRNSYDTIIHNFDDAQLNAGPQCAQCPVRQGTHCPAAVEYGTRMYDVCLGPSKDNETIENVVERYEMLETAVDHMRKLKDAYETRLIGLLKRNSSVPGYELKESSGRTTWRNTTEAIQLGELYGIDLRKESALTPKQAVNAGVPVEVIEQFTERKKTGLKLARINMKRVKEIFSQ